MERECEKVVGGTAGWRVGKSKYHREIKDGVNYIFCYNKSYDTI